MISKPIAAARDKTTVVTDIILEISDKFNRKHKITNNQGPKMINSMQWSGKLCRYESEEYKLRKNLKNGCDRKREKLKILTQLKFEVESCKVK